MEATRTSHPSKVDRRRLVWLTACCLVAMAIALEPAPAAGQELLTVESRQAKDQAASENELADTLKYLEKLEKLDKYWSEVARPRFGRSEYKQPALYAARADLPLRPMRMVRPMNAEPRAASLMDLVNARLAHRYNSNEAY